MLDTRRIALERQRGQISTEEMMAELTHPYSAHQYDPTGGDGFIPGTWRQIEDLFLESLITDEEYNQLARKCPIGPPMR